MIKWYVFVCGMCVVCVLLFVDKHLSVSIQGDVDVARAMEQTSTIARQFLLTTLFASAVYL